MRIFAETAEALFRNATTNSRRCSSGVFPSTGRSAGAPANPSGVSAAIIRGSARGSSPSVRFGEPSRPGSTGEPSVVMGNTLHSLGMRDADRRAREQHNLALPTSESRVRRWGVTIDVGS